MKKAIRLIIALTIALLLVISCAAEPEVAKGILKIDISSALTKGIAPNIDLKTSNYKIVVTDSYGAVQSFNIGASYSSEQLLSTGNYTVKAYAENKVGVEIGESEEKSFTIYPNKATSISLNIIEKAGTGSITIGFTGLDTFGDETTFSVSFTNGIGGSLDNTSKKTFPILFNSDGSAYAVAELENGFYTISLESSNDDADLFLDTVRIVCGDEVSAAYSFEYSSEGVVSIKNSIIKTPIISVKKSGDELPITLASTIKNLEGAAAYAWYMDGKILPGANEKDLEITEESRIESGEHVFMLLVISDTGIVWTSEYVLVTISEIETPEITTSTQNENEFYNISTMAFIGGSVVYNPDSEQFSQLKAGAEIAFYLNELDMGAPEILDGGEATFDPAAVEGIDTSAPESVYSFDDEKVAYGYLRVESVSGDSVKLASSIYSNSGKTMLKTEQPISRDENKRPKNRRE